MARKKYGRGRGASPEEELNAKMWKFIGNLARNQQIDPENSEIWGKFLEDEDVEKSKEELAERFAKVLVPKIGKTEFDIRVKIRLYLALPIPLDAQFKEELRKKGKNVKTDKKKWMTACGYLKRPNSRACTSSDEETVEPPSPTFKKHILPAPFTPPTVPSAILTLQSHWRELSESLEPSMLTAYKSVLRRLLNGRISCLQPLSQFIPQFPQKLLAVHEKLYTSLCQASEAFAFKNHNASTLISQHKLPDKCQIGAQFLLECISQGIVPFDVIEESAVCEKIELYMRIAVKDMIEEAVRSGDFKFPISIVDRLINN